jgi:glutaminase
MVSGKTADEVWGKIIGTYNDYAGRQLTVLQDVYKSEADTNQRNQAIGALMLAYGYIKSNWQQAVDLYTKQCSVGVNAKDLAMMAATLAAGGKNPVTGKVLLDANKVPGVLAVMATAGLYDDSGKWLFRTGLPAKSGVGGGLIACRQGSSASRSSRRRSTRPATACARSGRSPRSPTRSAAIPYAGREEVAPPGAPGQLPRGSRPWSTPTGLT